VEGIVVGDIVNGNLAVDDGAESGDDDDSSLLVLLDKACGTDTATIMPKPNTVAAQIQ
jgi:hypothetical protein